MALANNRVHREEREWKEEESAVSVTALAACVCANSGRSCFLKKGAFIDKADIKHWLFCRHQEDLSLIRDTRQIFPFHLALYGCL